MSPRFYHSVVDISEVDITPDGEYEALFDLTSDELDIPLSELQVLYSPRLSEMLQGHGVVPVGRPAWKLITGEQVKACEGLLADSEVGLVAYTPVVVVDKKRAAKSLPKSPALGGKS